VQPLAQFWIRGNGQHNVGQVCLPHHCLVAQLDHFGLHK
jgi:hypothetical protein